MLLSVRVFSTEFGNYIGPELDDEEDDEEEDVGQQVTARELRLTSV